MRISDWSSDVCSSDLLGARYGGNLARFCGVIVLVSASFTYVTAQIFGVGIIASRFLGISFEVAVFVGLAGILVCSMLGGMRAVTWTQEAQRSEEHTSELQSLMRIPYAVL